MTKQCFDEFHRLFGIRYPFGDYHQAFVPEFNAGAMENPGCVTFRDPLIFSKPGDPRRPHPAGHHGGARDGAPVVRQHRHPEVVGRPVAQRVLRRVHGQPGHRRRHRVRRRLDPQRLRPPPVGPGRRPAAEHPPGRRQRRRGRDVGAAGLRRHLLRQGLEHPQAAQRHARRRGLLRRRDRPLHPAPVRQRHHARPLRELGAGRCGRPERVHQQLAAHRRAGHDRARPGRRRRAAYSPGRPPRRPPAHPAGRHRGSPRASGSSSRSPSTPPETAFDVADGRRRSSSTPTRTPGRSSSPTPTTVAALQDAAAAPPTTPGCGPASGTTSAAPSTTPPSTPPTCSTWSRRALPGRGQRRRGRSTRCRGRSRRSSRSPPTPTPRCDRVHAVALAEGRRRRRRRRPCSCRRSRRRSARPPTPGSSGAWLAGRVLPDGIERRPRPALADPGPARRARRDRPRPSSQAALEAEPTARSRVEHSRAMASLPDAEAKAWAWARFTGEVDVPNYELEAAGLGMWRTGQEHLTDRVRRPLLRRRPPHRRGAQRLGPRGRRAGLLPHHVGDRGDPRQGPAPLIDLDGLDTSIRARRRRPHRRAASAGSRSGRPTRPVTDLCRERAPAPPRTHGPDPRARAHRRRRAAARGPARHRGAAGDPARVAGSRPAPGLGDHAHPRPRLRARGRVAAARGPGPARRHPRGRLLHRRRPHPGAGVQRRDGDPRRAAGARPRPPAHRAVARARRRAGCAARTA